MAKRGTLAYRKTVEELARLRQHVYERQRDDPSPEEIEEMCIRFQQGWTETEKAERWRACHYYEKSRVLYGKSGINSLGRNGYAYKTLYPDLKTRGLCRCGKPAIKEDWTLEQARRWPLLPYYTHLCFECIKDLQVHDRHISSENHPLRMGNRQDVDYLPNSPRQIRYEEMHLADFLIDNKPDQPPWWEQIGNEEGI